VHVEIGAPTIAVPFPHLETRCLLRFYDAALSRSGLYKGVRPTCLPCFPIVDGHAGPAVRIAGHQHANQFLPSALTSVASAAVIAPTGTTLGIVAVGRLRAIGVGR
jgi:hypothetical protein